MQLAALVIGKLYSIQKNYLVFFTETDQKVNRTEKTKPSKEHMAEEMSNAKQFHMEPEKERLTHSVR